MEVHAKSKFDYESIKALSHASTYRFIKPKTPVIATIICSIIFIAAELDLGLNYGIERVSFPLVVVVVVCACLNFYYYFGLPKVRYNSLGKMKNTENEYIFGDETIKVSSRNEVYSAEGELKYSMIPKVVETSKYLFVFQSNHRAYVIDKSTITNGTIEDIREKLTQYVEKKKYTTRRF